MKDLFKGHHPWLLGLVIAVDIFSALVIRHSIPLQRRIRIQCQCILLPDYNQRTCPLCNTR